VAIGAGIRPHQMVTEEQRTYLENVLSWLVINSMRVDSIQFNLLCEQSVSNVWRKKAFSNLKADYRMVEATSGNLGQLERALQIFRERLDHEIENSVPKTISYSEKIQRAIGNHT
jgi:hypothetical protein